MNNNHSQEGKYLEKKQNQITKPQTNHQKNYKFITQLDLRGIQLHETACETRKFILHCVTQFFNCNSVSFLLCYTFCEINKLYRK